MNTGLFIQIIIGLSFVMFIIFIIALLSGSRRKTKVLNQIDIITDELDRQKKENNRLKEHLKRINSIDNVFFSSMIRLTSRFEPKDIAEEITGLLANCLDTDQVVVFLADTHCKRLSVISHRGLNDNWVPKLVYEIADNDRKGKVGACFERTHRISQHEFAILDIKEPYPVFDPDLCLPVFFHEKKYGVIALTRKEALTEREMSLLGVVSNIAGVALNNTKSFESIEKTAHTDPLTGIFNVGYFKDKLRAELDRAKRFQHNLSVAIIDLDNFKTYNDTYGHQKGDELLMNLAKLFRNHFDKTDTVARYGGDEFIVMCPEIKKQEAAKILTTLLHDLKAYDFSRGPKKVKVAFSAGVSSYPDDAINETQLIKLADQALYEAKGAGRNIVKAYKAKIEKI